MPYKTNVTYIDDLPDMEDLQNSYTYGAIRSQAHYQQQRDMDPRRQAQMMQQMRGMEMFPQPPQHLVSPSSRPYMSPQQPQYTSTNGDQAQQIASCLDLMSHAQNCPLCAKVYDNDKTVYIVTIIVLAIICILLLKKVLNL